MIRTEIQLLLRRHTLDLAAASSKVGGSGSNNSYSTAVVLSILTALGLSLAVP
jgi:hypothetical protein